MCSVHVSPNSVERVNGISELISKWHITAVKSLKATYHCTVSQIPEVQEESDEPAMATWHPDAAHHLGFPDIQRRDPRDDLLIVLRDLHPAHLHSTNQQRRSSAGAAGKRRI